MKLKSYNYLYYLLIIFLFFTPLKSEDEINLWKNKKKNQSVENKKTIGNEDTQKLNVESIKKIELDQNIEIKDGPR